jgi:hypothetical protein
MQRVATAIFAMVLVVLVTAESVNAAHGRHKTSPRCRLPAHARVLLADAQAQVFESPESGLTGPYKPREINACAYGHRHVYVLGEPLGPGDPQGNEGVTSETLAGAIVAYEFSSTPPSCCEVGRGGEAVVVVRDLRSGRVLHKVPTGTPSAPRAAGIGLGPALSLVVKSDGAVAWIVSAGFRNGYYQVHALDGSGSRTLATGRSIDPRARALAGSTLYWTQEGKPFSSALN